MGETIALKQTGVVLTQVPTIRYPWFEWQHGKIVVVVRMMTSEGLHWRSEFVFRGRHDSLGEAFDHCGLDAESAKALAMNVADERLLALRAALTPPGHVLVGPDARETVAAVLWSDVLRPRYGEDCEWKDVPTCKREGALSMADAVLRAIGVRGGA